MKICKHLNYKQKASEGGFTNLPLGEIFLKYEDLKIDNLILL